MKYFTLVANLLSWNYFFANISILAFTISTKLLLSYVKTKYTFFQTKTMFYINVRFLFTSLIEKWLTVGLIVVHC